MEEVRKYSADAKPPEINAPLKQRTGLGNVLVMPTGWASCFGVGVW